MRLLLTLLLFFLAVGFYVAGVEMVVPFLSDQFVLVHWLPEPLIKVVSLVLVVGVLFSIVKILEFVISVFFSESEEIQSKSEEMQSESEEMQSESEEMQSKPRINVYSGAAQMSDGLVKMSCEKFLSRMISEPTR